MALQSPTQVYKYTDVLKLHLAYVDAEKQAGYKDFFARLVKVRDELRSDLLQGTVDKFGNTRDNEKRAALMVLERMILFPNAVHRQYEELKRRKDEQDEKSKRKTGIHDGDILNTTSGSKPGRITAY